MRVCACVCGAPACIDQGTTLDAIHGEEFTFGFVFTICLFVYCDVCVEVGGQLPGIRSPSTTWVPGINSGHQSWQQIPLPVQPSCQPHLIFETESRWLEHPNQSRLPGRPQPVSASLELEFQVHHDFFLWVLGIEPRSSCLPYKLFPN